MSVSIEERLDKRAQNLSEMFKLLRARLGDGSGGATCSISLRSGKVIQGVRYFRQEKEGTDIDGVIFAIVDVNDDGDAHVVRFIVDDVETIETPGIAIVSPDRRESHRDVFVDAIFKEIYGRDDNGDQIPILIEACQTAEATTFGAVRADEVLLAAVHASIDEAREHGETWPDTINGQDHKDDEAISSLNANVIVAALEKVYVTRKLVEVVDQSYSPFIGPDKWENNVRITLGIVPK